MEEKLDLLLIKLQKLEDKIDEVKFAIEAHRTEHSLSKGPGMGQAPPGMPHSGGTPGGYQPGGIPFGPPDMGGGGMGGGVPFGPPGM